VRDTTSGEGDPLVEGTDAVFDDDEDAVHDEDVRAAPDRETTGSDAGSEAEPAGDDAAGTEDRDAGAADGEWVPEAATTAPKRAGTIRDTAAAKAASAARTEKPGRSTPKGGRTKQAPRAGRYTPPIPKERRQSPRWFAPVLLGFLLLGLATIVLNYVNVLPGVTSNWYLISGIVLIVVGLFMATFYH